jgi:glycosyltransferase involved in cell wall biosynthesis
VSTPTTISACIIACNESERLPACLASVAFCDEIVVVDSGSTDDTVAIAKEAGARVVVQPWLGFPAQRNVALDGATCDWVLEIDADERLTPELAEQIRTFLERRPAEVDMGALPLRNIFLGRPLGPSAKYPEYRRRLLRRASYRHDEERTVHEALVPHGPVHPFTADLEHVLAGSLHEALADAWRYARLETGQMESRLTALTFIRGAFVRPAAKFVYRMLVDGGWRDGWRGTTKIAIDCSIDSTVWVRHLAGRRGEAVGRSGVESSSHYGATNFRAGGPRVVGVAFGARSRARACDWLRSLQSAGGDAALLSNLGEDGTAPSADQGVVRVRRLSRANPLYLIRALDAEQQLRTIDAVVAFGPRARTLLRVVPAGLRGAVRGIYEGTDPLAVAERVQLATATQTPARNDGRLQSDLREVS